MKQTKLFFFLLAALVILNAGSLQSQDWKKLVEEGDKLATKQFKNNDALKKFKEADKLSPNNWEIYWRLSRTYVDIGEHSGGNSQLSNFETAESYASKAIKLAPDKSVNYLRRAIANGRIALFKNVFSAAGIVNSVKADVEKAIQLGNGGSEIQATANYVLGRTHNKLCEKAYIFRAPLGLGWGDIDEAIKYLNKAIKLRPNFRMFHLEIAKAYIEDDQYDKARTHLNKVAGIPFLDEDDATVLAEAKNLLNEIKGK
ncbi:MAG: tetratricopeptide repeat protein [Bacteroidetes bacterium]|nr:tetratricopeptide repeat protein [Bacteroidota bacterium]